MPVPDFSVDIRSKCVPTFRNLVSFSERLCLDAQAFSLESWSQGHDSWSGLFCNIAPSFWSPQRLVGEHSRGARAANSGGEGEGVGESEGIPWPRHKGPLCWPALVTLDYVLCAGPRLEPSLTAMAHAWWCVRVAIGVEQSNQVELLEALQISVICDSGRHDFSMKFWQWAAKNIRHHSCCRLTIRDTSHGSFGPPASAWSWYPCWM